MAPLLNRRGALVGLTGLGALWAVPTVALAQAAPPLLSWTPKVLTADEARTLTAACERIMPATDTPGAAAAGVPQFIDKTLAIWSEPADAQRLRAGLAALDADARAKFGAPFAGLSPAQQDQVLTAAQSQPYFRQLREMTTSAYFTSQVGATKALRYDPVPGAYHGCVPVAQIGRAWATS